MAAETDFSTDDPPRLSRAGRGLPPAAPVRLVHLGLGNFHRAHQAWYTANAGDAGEWGIAAFTGRRPDVAEQLAPQDGLYTLITRSADGDSFAVLESLVAVHPSTDHEAYLDELNGPWPCTAPGCLDNGLRYAARLKVSSCQTPRMWAGLRWPFFSISHSAL